MYVCIHVYIHMYIYTHSFCVFFWRPFQGHLRVDHEHIWNAVSPNFGAEEEGRKVAGEPQLLHPGHGDLDLENLMFCFFCFMAFNLKLLDIFFFLWGSASL